MLLLGRCSSASQTKGAVVVALRFALSGGAMSNLLLAYFLKLSNNRGLIAEAAQVRRKAEPSLPRYGHSRYPGAG
jgi:hypothetical protein